MKPLLECQSSVIKVPGINISLLCILGPMLEELMIVIVTSQIKNKFSFSFVSCYIVEDTHFKMYPKVKFSQLDSAALSSLHITALVRQSFIPTISITTQSQL